jgi:hypothetical protein
MAGPNGTGASAPPVANRAVVQGELRRALISGHRNPAGTVLLLRAAPEWRDDERFDVEVPGFEAPSPEPDGGQAVGKVPVAVAACPTVLAVLDALAAPREPGRYLVVLTPLETAAVGESVLARGIRDEVKPINRWDLVQDAFGARLLDPALTQHRWVAEALLDAQPTGGWRRLAGTTLTRATALNRLAAVRLGIESVADESGVDAAALLEWTADPAAVASFLALRDTERDGIITWLKEETAKRVADAVFTMAAAGKVTDAVPFGLVTVALYRREDTLTARVRAEERYLAGASLDPETTREFGEAAESLVARWADNGHAPLAAAMCERAEAILRDLGGSAAAGESKVLEAGLDARLAALAEALSAALDALSEPSAPAGPVTRGKATAGPSASLSATAVRTALAAAEEDLEKVTKHGRRKDRDAEIEAAMSAVRLLRWLAAPEELPATLADGALRMLRSWSWADRCLEVIYRADTSRVPALAAVYSALWDRARNRRARLDEAFARKLAAWTQGSVHPDDLLLVENLLDRIARPVAGQRLPVIIVLDGMSAAVASELTEEIVQGGLWMEAGRRDDGREPALATVPSVTAISRASLLSGALRTGGQAQEHTGFTAFWGRRKSRLFHKADLLPDPGQSLAAEVRDAISDPDTVVGIVLNTIDDTLAKEKPGGPAHWEVDDVTYLRAILNEARRASRPVILTADHGYVLSKPGADQDQERTPVLSESARYRSGTPGPGEVAIRGPRVLNAEGKPGGELVAAVDEAIHYTPKKAGYHGGASPAEVVVPVITLLPSVSLLPPGWYAYDAVGHAPSWWTAPAGRVPVLPADQAPVTPAQPTAGKGKKRPAPVADDSDPLFEVSEIAPDLVLSDEPIASASAGQARTDTLGTKVAASTRMASQRQFVRRAPGDASIAALIDALISAGGRLTATEAATATGEAPVRMSGYLAQATRLLNVDSYPVLQVKDGGKMVELNEQLLRQQFLQ